MENLIAYAYVVGIALIGLVFCFLLSWLLQAADAAWRQAARKKRKIR